MDAFNTVLREMLFVTATLALPVLVAATLTGTVIALLQAVTQVQEQTLTLLPKLCVVGAIVIVFGGFGFNALAELVRTAVASMGAIVRVPL